MTAALLPGAAGLQRAIDVGLERAAGVGRAFARRPRTVGSVGTKQRAGVSRAGRGSALTAVGLHTPGAPSRLVAKRDLGVGGAESSAALARLRCCSAAINDQALGFAERGACWRRALTARRRLRCATSATSPSVRCRRPTHSVGRTTHRGGGSGHGHVAARARHACCGHVTAHAGHAACRLASHAHRRLATGIGACGAGARSAVRATSVLARHRAPGAGTRAASSAAASYARATISVRAAGPDRTTNCQRHDRILKACPHDVVSGTAGRRLWVIFRNSLRDEKTAYLSAASACRVSSAGSTAHYPATGRS
jgi:hypothetical protein